MSRYKAKQCPTCGVTHKKRGAYCCRSCGNSRSFSTSDRQNLSHKMKQHFDTPEGQERALATRDTAKVSEIKRKNSHDPDAAELTLDDFFLQPVIKTLPDGQFVQDGDLWTEKDW